MFGLSIFNIIINEELSHLFIIGSWLLKLLFILLGVALFTHAERVVMAAFQRRTGPNRVGPWGLLQPIADGLKLIPKNVTIPVRATKELFLFAPFWIITLNWIAWIIIPLSYNQDNILMNLNN